MEHKQSIEDYIQERLNKREEAASAFRKSIKLFVDTEMYRALDAFLESLSKDFTETHFWADSARDRLISKGARLAVDGIREGLLQIGTQEEMEQNLPAYATIDDGFEDDDLSIRRSDLKSDS